MRLLTFVSLAVVAVIAVRPCAGPEAETPAGYPEEAVAGGARAVPGAEPHWQAAARRTIARSLPFIEREGVAWMEGRVSVQDGRACVSCHHVGYALWSHAEARRAGIEGGEAIAELAATAVEFLDRPSLPRAMSASPVMLAEPVLARPLAAHLPPLQTDAGGWPAKGQFPTQRRPLAESDAVATMYALLALDGGERAGAGGDDAASAARERALDWLAGVEPGTSTEWLAVRLLLANDLGDREGVRLLAEALAARQHPDGGWGFVEGDPSDAFSTGQALYALAAVAAEGSEEAVMRAAFYLVSSQEGDGTWRVPSAAISVKPSAGKDVVYRFWGTAWATLGLARSLPSASGAEPSVAGAEPGAS